MKAAICEKFGEPTEVLFEGDVPIPKFKDNQVLIKTSYGVIHNHNYSLVKGEYGYKPKMPYVGGDEGAGVIVEVGSRVRGFKIGERVSCTKGLTGTWAEYFVASTSNLVKVPDLIDDKEASQLISMPLSALLLLEALNVKDGQWFAYNCANGLVGQMLAAICKARGVNMLKIVRRREAKDLLIKQGFDNIVDASEKDWRAQVKKIVGKQPIVAGVDNIGGHASGQILSLLANDGILWSFGNLTGKPMELKSPDIIFTDRVIKGYWAAKTFQNFSEKEMHGFEQEIVDYVANKQIVLPVGGIFTYAQVKEAFKAQENSKDGKILIGPGPTIVKAKL